MKTTTTRILGSLAAGAVLATGSVAVAAPAGATTTPAPCVSERWPAATNGRPAAHPEAEGVYLWHSDAGWRLRVNEPGADRAVFTGTITVDGQLVSWARHLENAGEGVVGRANEGRAAFRFVNYGGVDGLNFVTRCASTLTVHVRMNGVPVGADHVYIGADGHHPASLPTVITRGA
jgi:hypothetical protein